MNSKDSMPDADLVLSEEDQNAIASYLNEKKAGKLVSHEALKKELGL